MLMDANLFLKQQPPLLVKGGPCGNHRFGRVGFGFHAYILCQRNSRKPRLPAAEFLLLDRLDTGHEPLLQVHLNLCICRHNLIHDRSLQKGH